MENWSGKRSDGKEENIDSLDGIGKSLKEKPLVYFN